MRYLQSIAHSASANNKKYFNRRYYVPSPVLVIMCIRSFNQPMRSILSLSPFYRERKLRHRELDNFLKVMQF